MADELSVKWAKKLVKLPDGSTVPVRVRVRTVFKDTVSQAQDTIYYIDNSHSGRRKVHVDKVESSTTPGATIDVERCDVWQGLDMVSGAQENHLFFNNAVSTSPPPYFVNHAKTHLVTYKNNPDNGISVTSEMIDEMHVVDTVSQGQEIRFYLDQPQTDDAAQAQDNDPDITDSDNGIDPPWRTDPFQNIVDFKVAENIGVVWRYNADYDYTPGHPLPTNITGLSFSTTGPTGFPPGFVVSGSPTVGSLLFDDDPKTLPWVYSSTGQLIVFDADTDGVSAHGSVDFKALSTFSDPSSLHAEGTLNMSISGISGALSGTPWTLYNVSIAFAPLLTSNPYGPAGIGGPVVGYPVFTAWFHP